jgi:MscS family membrane protein
MLDLFNIVFLGNELWRYGTFFLVLFSSYFVAGIFKFVIDRYLTAWAKKTAFELDDCLVNSLNPSITMFVWAGMFYVAGLFLNTTAFGLIFEKIFNFLMIIPIVYFMIKFSTEVLSHYLKTSTNGKKNEAAIDLLVSIVRISLFLIGILLILGNFGYDVTALLAGLGVGGLAFALAAQDILKNFFSGIALIFDKTFKKGEKVVFEGNSGIIEELKLRSTKLRTYDGTLLTIPNSMLADNIVENVTQVPVVKVKMTLGLTYNMNSKQIKTAKKIVMDVLTSQPDVDEPRTTVYFDSFGAFSLDLKVYYYAHKLTMDDWNERTQMKEDINLGILEGFEKAGIEMAFPTQTLHIEK